MENLRSTKHGGSEAGSGGKRERSHGEVPLLLIPDAILPEQYFPGPRDTEEVSGPRGLMLALLEDGIRCFFEDRNHPSLERRRAGRQAEAWIRLQDSSWPFSFENICQFLELDADSLREQLLESQAKSNPAKLRRSPRRVQRTPMHRVQKPRRR
jgi:hypothetical protein